MRKETFEETAVTNLITTRNYTVTKLENGTEITDRVTGNQIYLNCGNGEASLLGELSGLESRYASLRNCLWMVDATVDRHFAEYRAASDEAAADRFANIVALVSEMFSDDQLLTKLLK